MGFQRVTNTSTSNPEKKKFLSVYSSGKGRFSKPAVKKWDLEEIDRIELYADVENEQIGVAFGGGNGSFSLNDDGNGSCEVSMRSLLDEFGIVREDLDRSARLELEHDPSEGLLIADAIPLLEAAEGGDSE